MALALWLKNARSTLAMDVLLRKTVRTMSGVPVLLHKSGPLRVVVQDRYRRRGPLISAVHALLRLMKIVLASLLSTMTADPIFPRHQIDHFGLGTTLVAQRQQVLANLSSTIVDL